MSLETNLNKIHQTAYGIAHGELGEFAATSRPRLVCYHQQRWPTRRWSRPHITAQGHCMCHPGQGCQIHQKQEWSMKFCYSCFHVQIHKPLVQWLTACFHLPSEIRGKSTWAARVYDFARFGIPVLSKYHWLAATGISGFSAHGSIIKIQDKNSPPSHIPNPPKCPYLPATGFHRFKLQFPINITKRPSHVQGRQPHLPKTSFLKIWIGWMEAWWMTFSFKLSIYHSCFPGAYGWIHCPW